MAYNSQKRKLKAGETRRRIFESAVGLFPKNGYEKTSVDSIVEDAGVAKGSFYVHFKSKDAVLAAIFVEYVSNVDADYKGFVEALPKNTPASNLIILLAGKIADVIVENIGGEKMRAVYKGQLSQDLSKGAVMDYNREMYRLFKKLVEKGIIAGEFKNNFAADAVARHFVSALRGVTYEWCMRYHNFDYKAQATETFKILLEGINK